MALCPGLIGWASTRRNIHPLSHILIIRILYPLRPCTTIHRILLVQFTCFTVLYHNLSPGPLWSSSWSGTLYFILNTFLHPIIIFFCNTCKPSSWRFTSMWCIKTCRFRTTLYKQLVFNDRSRQSQRELETLQDKKSNKTDRQRSHLIWYSQQTVMHPKETAQPKKHIRRYIFCIRNAEKNYASNFFQKQLLCSF